MIFLSSSGCPYSGYFSNSVSCSSEEYFSAQIFHFICVCKLVQLTVVKTKHYFNKPVACGFPNCQGNPPVIIVMVALDTWLVMLEPTSSQTSYTAQHAQVEFEGVVNVCVQGMKIKLTKSYVFTDNLKNRYTILTIIHRT